ncbi:hypothetical protein HOY34_08520 [Xinfangfangia sp. D13-10-4-6]|uniref:hypothetical protein n=1 Tax=Pseudogemmobacter hezensis TaxID=2737662 RepID=UPI001554002F|nr:hypothetical protein [Pseudogemmobacter hezensis]NPD15241.1 hypothetical protein [Pseudogemmobacter hezensis]
MRQALSTALVVTALAAVAGCASESDQVQEAGKKEYLGIQTVLLQGDMVSFRVAIKGTQEGRDLEDYARCAAAQYALIRGAGFARHVRTNVAKSGGTIRGDSVWLVSAALPRGIKTIDAEVTVQDCGALGIPTV